MSLIGKVVGYWGLDGNSNDSQGGNNGTDTSISYNTPGFLGSDYANFGGAPSVIDISTSPITGTGSWSVFFWYRGTGSNEGLISFGTNGPQQAIKIYIHPTGTVNCDLEASGPGASSSTSVNDGNWHLLGVIYDSAGGKAQMYVDGSADGANVSIGSPNIGNTYAKFGEAQGVPNLNGDLDDISFYGDKLIAGEISSLWNGGSGNPYPFGYSDLVADQASFSLTGNAALLKRNYPLTASQASFTLTGNTLGISYGYPDLVADMGQFDMNQPPHLSNINLTLGTTNLLIAQRATFVLTGNDATIIKAFIVTHGAFTLTGNAVTLTLGGHADLVADTGVFTFNQPPHFFDVNLVPGITNLLIALRVDFVLTGYDAEIRKALITTTGTFTLTGNAVTLTPGGHADLVADIGIFELNQPPHLSNVNLTLGTTNLLIADRTTFALTGFDASIYRIISLSNGSFTLTGQDIATSRTYATQPTFSPFTLTGNAINYIYTRIFPVDQASFTLTGNAAGLYYGYYVSSTQASYSFTGNTADIYRYAYVSTTHGSFAVTGNANGFLRGLIVPVTQGSYSFTGQVIDLLRGRIMPVTHGTYTLTGNVASLSITTLMSVTHGVFVLTGKAVILQYASVNGAGLVQLNLEEAFAKLMDKNNPAWPGFPPGNAIVALNFANAIDAYAKFVIPQSAGATLGKLAMITAMMPLLSVPGPAPFYPAFTAGLLAYATALGVGMTSSGYVGVPPILPPDWVSFAALDKSGPLNEKIEELASTVHEWFITGTATPVLGGSTIDWS